VYFRPEFSLANGDKTDIIALTIMEKYIHQKGAGL
jgi:hypothetical protein